MAKYFAFTDLFLESLKFHLVPVDVYEEHRVFKCVDLHLLRSGSVDNDLYTLHVKISIVRSPLLLVKTDRSAFLLILIILSNLFCTAVAILT